MKVYKNLLGNGSKINVNEIAVTPEILLGSAVIVDSGSGDNGNWIRWGNGWQECIFRTSQNRDTEVFWIFPKPFNEPPNILLTPFRRAGDVFIKTQVGETTKTDTTCYKEAATNVNHALILKASGWWK